MHRVIIITILNEESLDFQLLAAKGQSQQYLEH